MTTKTSRPAVDEATPKEAPPDGTDFNLRTLVREVSRTSTLANPGALADEVMRRIPEGESREALRQALRVFVRQVISEERPKGSPGHPGGINPVPSRASSSRSSKVGAIRDGWQRHLRARYHVGASEWARLGDCTRDNLFFIADDLDRKADQNKAKARGIRSLAAALTDHDVAKVSDLPAQLLMASLGEAA